VKFEVSCNAAAQLEFNRAVAMLHSFFYPEAGRTFTKVTEIDPACGMGHWGVAMSWWYPLWYPPTKEALAQGAAAAAKARAVAPKTERELDYIAAIGMFYRDLDKLDHKSRALAFETAMERVYRRYPGDREAAAFYGLALQATADPNDKTYANQLKSAGILEQLFAEQPNHPGAAHYLIHAYDYPELALRRWLRLVDMVSRRPCRMPCTCRRIPSSLSACGRSQSSRTWRQASPSGTWDGFRRNSTPWTTSSTHICKAHRWGLRGRLSNSSLRSRSTRRHAHCRSTTRWRQRQHAFFLNSDVGPMRPRSLHCRRFPATQALTYFARALGAVHTGPG
jgi:hypothetical protein